jgi:hypothetical protein
MLELEQQLGEYGEYLDELDAEAGVETEVVALPAARRPNRMRLVAAAVTVLALIGGSIAVATRRESPHRVTTIGNAPKDSTPTTGPSAITSADPTFDQQVAQLNRWYAHAVADAPGGRPILLAEYEVCDYRGAPTLGSNVQGGFASYFPLVQPLTDARLADGCLHRDDIPKGTSAPHRLCSADVRGPVYDTKARVVKLVTKPVVMFGASDCAAAGYEPFTPGLLHTLNRRRKVEIEIRAVPRDCPTGYETGAWVTKITAKELGAPWAVVEAPGAASGTTATVPPPSSPSASAGNCVRPGRVDWDLRLVTLERF